MEEMRDLKDAEWDQVAGGFGAETLGGRPNCIIPVANGKPSTLSRDWLEPYINDPREVLDPAPTAPHHYPFGWLNSANPSFTPQRHAFFDPVERAAERPLDTGQTVSRDEKRTHQPPTLSWKMPYLNR